MSEQQLAALIPPSLRYLLVLATHRQPRYLLRILNSFDEVYAGISLLIERYYLRHYGGSFTENFYGLKRERAVYTKSGDLPRASLSAPTHVREITRLRTSDVWKNLVVIVALPYLKRKLDESYDVHAASTNVLGSGFAARDRVTASTTLRQRIVIYYKWFLRNVYPSINAAYYFALLAWNMAYLFDATRYSSPFLWIIESRIRRMNGADYRALAQSNAKQTARPRSAARPGLVNSVLHPRVLATTVYDGALSSLKLALPASMFALKFLEWWHASDFAAQLSKQSRQGIDLPPPVVSDDHATQKAHSKTETTNTETKKSSAPAEADSHLQITSPPTSSLTGKSILTVSKPDTSAADTCPICQETMQTPTVSPYGHVFCYTCIFRWVDGSHAVQETFMAQYPASVADGHDVHEDGLDGNHDAREDGSDGSDGDVVREKSMGWESGAGRCAVSGKRILGGTGALRRVMV